MTSFTYKKNNVDITDLVLTQADFDPSTGLWYSDQKSITNYTTLTTIVEYEDINPDGANVNVDFRIQAMVQGLEDNNHWFNMVVQNTSIRGSEQAPIRRLIASESVTNYEPGVEYDVPDALGLPSVGVSAEQVTLPDSVRICVRLADINGEDPINTNLVSFKLSLSGFLT